MVRFNAYLCFSGCNITYAINYQGTCGVSSDTGYQVKPLSPEQWSALIRFYKSNQYKGKIKASDKVWIMTNSKGQIVGAARLCQQAGYTLLRGVWVDKTLCSQGLGSQLLRHLKRVGALEGCYCFPYLHLELFYSKHGFSRVASVPASLSKALTRYNRHTIQVLLMVQERESLRLSSTS